MKTAISLPDDLFQEAEAAASQAGLSRSQLYANALRDFLAHRRDDSITARLNEVYSSPPAKVDPALEAAQFSSIERESW